MADYGSLMGQQFALRQKLTKGVDKEEPAPWEGAAPGATFNVPASSVPPEVAGAYANNPDGTVTLPAGVMPAYKGGGTPVPGPTAPVQTDTEVPGAEQGVVGPMAVPARTQPQQYTAGGMMRTGETRQVGIGINAAERANLDMGHDRQAAAMREAALQGQAKAVEEAEYVKATADQQEQHAIEMKAREYDREQKTEAAMAPMRALSDELAAGKVDPSRYLQNQSTGAKLATMLSVVLGAGAAQRINGRNTGLDMMNDAIARDIDAQKASFDMKRGALGAKQNLYGQMLQTFGREDLAKEAAHLAILKGYGAKISAIGAKYAGTEIANKAEAAAGQFQEQYGERELKLRQATSDVVTTSDTYRAPQAIGGGGGGIPGAMPLNEKNFVQTGPNGEGFIAPDDASKIREGRADSKGLQDILKEAADLKEKATFWDNIVEASPTTALGIHTENFRKRGELQSEGLTKKSVLEKQGAMAGHDAAIAGQALGNIMNISGDAGEIRSAAGRVQKITDNAVASSGGLTGRAAWVTDSRGVPRRIFIPSGATTFDAANQPAPTVKVQPVGKK
mgnify:FL=1